MSSPLMEGLAKLYGTLRPSWTPATFEFGFPGLAGATSAPSRFTTANKPATGKAANDNFANSRRVWGSRIANGSLLLTLRAEMEPCFPSRLISGKLSTPIHKYNHVCVEHS